MPHSTGHGFTITLWKICLFVEKENTVGTRWHKWVMKLENLFCFCFAMDINSDTRKKAHTSLRRRSVLGPMLFIVYIINLNKHTKSMVRLFADDIILNRQILSQADTRFLQRDLEKLENGNWTGKCPLMPASAMFSLSQGKHNLVTSFYTLHGEELQQVISAKYLGIELTSKLHWELTYIPPVPEPTNLVLSFAVTLEDASP